MERKTLKICVTFSFFSLFWGIRAHQEMHWLETTAPGTRLGSPNFSLVLICNFFLSSLKFHFVFKDTFNGIALSDLDNEISYSFTVLIHAELFKFSIRRAKQREKGKLHDEIRGGSISTCEKAKSCFSLKANERKSNLYSSIIFSLWDGLSVMSNFSEALRFIKFCFVHIFGSHFNQKTSNDAFTFCTPETLGIWNTCTCKIKLCCL